MSGCTPLMHPCFQHQMFWSQASFSTPLVQRDPILTVFICKMHHLHSENNLSVIAQYDIVGKCSKLLQLILTHNALQHTVKLCKMTEQGVTVNFCSRNYSNLLQCSKQQCSHSSLSYCFTHIWVKHTTHKQLRCWKAVSMAAFWLNYTARVRALPASTWKGENGWFLYESALKVYLQELNHMQMEHHYSQCRHHWVIKVRVGMPLALV